jgi:SpoVK/Ycf46/Vps4 family AAA+-type ATPase
MLSRFRGNLIYMGLPNEQEREAILGMKLGKVKLASDVNLADIAERTDLYSGRDLDAICLRVKSAAMDKNLADPNFDAISHDMLLEALSKSPKAADPKHLQKLGEWSSQRGIKISGPMA